MSQRGEVPFFTDDDFAWVEPAFETVPTLPVTVRPRARRRSPARTLKGDLRRLRDSLARQRSNVSPARAILLAVAFGVALVVLLVALVVVRPLLGGGQDAPARQAARTNVPASPPENAPSRMRALQPGDRTAAVADLQAALAALGLYSAPIDGVFGDGTGAAVLAFQANHGLLPDGVAGPSTIRALVRAVGAGARQDAKSAREGLAAAAAAGRMSAARVEQVKGLLAGSISRLEHMRPGRIAALALVFHDVAALAPDYNEPRALALFSMLKTNADFFAAHRAPLRKDIRDADGIVYRYFQNHGYVFHPIAAFARLNKLARQGDRKSVARLAPALAARGVPSGGALLWEYYFAFGGPSRWTSGFAQATAAQALARSGKLLGDAHLLAQARAAYRGIAHGLVLHLGGGLWIREYGFSDMAILNAHLQALVSLYEYARIAEDAQAAATAARMDSAAHALLARFDTGCWSRYSLGGSPASLTYHTYHVKLLGQLAALTGDPLWSQTEARWKGYLDSGGPGAC